MSQMDTTLSNQIYLSRDKIRTQIIEYLQYYLELENVDLVKSSFLSFIVDTLSTLTSNLLFYSSSTYKEFFLTTAQLPESILNLSAFLGYNTTEASYATANVLINIPFGFDDSIAHFHIPENFKFYAGRIEFTTYYDTAITITNNTSVSVIVTQDSTKIYNLPVNIDSTSSEPSFTFVLPLYQYKEVIQEFQIDEDTELYQFINIDVPLSGKVSSMLVEVQDPEGTSWRTYTEFNSVYLMSSIDYGYVSRSTSSGRKLTFGNGIIGIHPLPGSTVKVTAKITEGANGNVIPTSITKGGRMYVTNSFGVTKIINYTVTNTSPATGGQDEESTEEVRSNAIASLVALKRLTSEYDYKHSGAIIPNSPIAETSIPVLKRSDVRVNEIQLFSTVEFGTTTRISSITGETITENFVVPTRNAKYEIPMSTTYIPRDTIISINSTNYYTLFDIHVDLINASASYSYIMYEIENVPVLVTSYGLVYDILCDKLVVSKVGTTAVFEISYNSTESDYELCVCKLTISSSSLVYTMTNDYTNKKFTYTFSPYTLFPEDDSDLEFTIYTNSGDPIATYSSSVTFRKNLSDFMMSNVYIDTVGGTTTIYDIPVVEKTYYDSIVKKDFELDVLQKMMTVMDFKSYRMLTDFTNLKFTNTTGSMTNMNLNAVTKSDVIDIGIIIPPTPVVDDRYIIGYTEIGEWADKNNQIAQCIDSTGLNWYYFPPTTNDIIYVTNKGKKYIFNGNKWVLMDKQIPLIIEVEVFKAQTYYGSNIELSNVIKDTLLTEYSSRFGPNVTLYRSELIRTIQSVSGVGHCNLLQPSTDIFFEYDISDFTETELLEYGPEYVYFNSDSIFIRIY